MNDKTKLKSFRLTGKDFIALEKQADIENITISELIRRAYKKYLKEQA